MTIIAFGKLSDVLIEMDGSSQVPAQVILNFASGEGILLTGVLLGEHGDFRLPAPFGCSCTISDIADRGWEERRYEVEFASGYSREGVFHAASAQKVRLSIEVSPCEADA